MVAREAADNESLRLELQETIVTVRHWSSLLFQAIGFFIAANVVLVSYGFAQKIAGILLLGSTLPIDVLILIRIVRSTIIPLIGLVLRIERRLLVQEDSLGATLAADPIVGSIGITFGDIEKLDDKEVRELNLSSSGWHWLRGPGPILLFTATVTQLGLFALALAVFHYRFM